MAGLATGSILAAGLVALADGRGAFVCLAAILLLAAALVARSVLSADAAALPVVEMARLRALPIFRVGWARRRWKRLPARSSRSSSAGASVRDPRRRGERPLLRHRRR